MRLPGMRPSPRSGPRLCARVCGLYTLKNDSGSFWPEYAWPGVLVGMPVLPESHEVALYGAHELAVVEMTPVLLSTSTVANPLRP